MSNKASDQLHKLIKAMTKPEKRYFKVFSSRHTSADDNKYVALFDAIEAQKEFSEEELQKIFKGDPIVNNFSIAKNRLYDSILRSLDIFHAQSSIDARLKKELHCAEILYKKTLYDQCARLLSSARKLAIRYERYSTLLEICQWEKKLTEKDNYSGKSDDDINNLLAVDEEIARKIKNLNDFWNIKSRFFMLLNKTGKVRNAEEMKKFKAIISHPLLKSDEQALTHETRYLYHHIYSAYYFGIDEYENSHQHLAENIRLIEENTDLFREEPNIYFSILTNAIYISSQLNKFGEAFELLEKLRKVPQTFEIGNNEDMEIKLFSSALSIEITLYNSMGEFERSSSLFPLIEDGLKKYEGRINPLRKGYFLLNLAVAHFGLEEYNKALKRVNEVLNDTGIAENQDIHCFARIVDLIVHLELGNEDLIPYTYKSTLRYLQTRKRVYKFENIFMDFITKLMKHGNTQNPSGVYAELAEELERLSKDPFERTAFEYFDFLSWAHHKATRRSFREIVKEKILVKS